MEQQRDLIYSFGVSADGFFAGPKGEIDWATPDEELHRFHNEQTAQLAANICGRGLYEDMLPWEARAEDPEITGVSREFAEIWKRQLKLVFSHTLDSVEGNARLIEGDAVEEVARLKSEPGGDLGVGGAHLAASLITHDLVDEFRLFINPVLVGGGTTYFPPLRERRDLELIETRLLRSAGRLPALQARPLRSRYGCPLGSLCSAARRPHRRARPDGGATASTPDPLGRSNSGSTGRRDARNLAVAMIASYEGIAQLTNTFRDPDLMTREERRLERWIDSLTPVGDQRSELGPRVSRGGSRPPLSPPLTNGDFQRQLRGEACEDAQHGRELLPGYVAQLDWRLVEDLLGTDCGGAPGGGQLDELCPTILRMGQPRDQPTFLEVVDHQRDVRRVCREKFGQSSQRMWLRGERA